MAWSKINNTNIWNGFSLLLDIVWFWAKVFFYLFLVNATRRFSLEEMFKNKIILPLTRCHISKDICYRCNVCYSAEFDWRVCLRFCAYPICKCDVIYVWECFYGNNKKKWFIYNCVVYLSNKTCYLLSQKFHMRHIMAEQIHSNKMQKKYNNCIEIECGQFIMPVFLLAAFDYFFCLDFFYRFISIFIINSAHCLLDVWFLVRQH